MFYGNDVPTHGFLTHLTQNMYATYGKLRLDIYIVDITFLPIFYMSIIGGLIN